MAIFNVLMLTASLIAQSTTTRAAPITASSQTDEARQLDPEYSDTSFLGYSPPLSSSTINPDLYIGNQADKDLDMRPAKHEPEVSDEEALLRFDRYRTEPSFRIPRVSIEQVTQEKEKLAPGYYFYAPYEAGAAGPYIFDQEGQLIYWGVNGTTEDRIKNFSPCDYLGSTQSHLCWSEVYHDSKYGHEYVTNHILDNTYSHVGPSYGAVDGWQPPNSHEYNMLPGGRSFIQAVYQFKQQDLTAYGGPEEGWIHDGCFQEVDVKTGESVFSWCATDHFDLDETYMYLDVAGQTNFTEGIGGIGTYQRSWDWIHMNSIDKFPDGSYLLSSRHFNSVFKISGAFSPTPGSILWRLGGKHNSFTSLSPFHFSRQHHARVLSSSGTTTTISLFNNNFEVRNSVALDGLSSSGLIITLDEEEMTAELVQAYTHPDHASGWRESVAIAEGSFQVLPGGNALADWGSLPDVTEFSAEGEVLFHASIANHHGRSYRAFKSEWHASPHWGPKLIAYARTCKVDAEGGSPFVAHVSWNGATEVASWQVHTSDESASGPWTMAGTVAKEGFETTIDLSEARAAQSKVPAPFVRAVALDAQGAELGETVAATSVPSSAMLGHCDGMGCDESVTMGLGSVATMCVRDEGVSSARQYMPSIVVMILVVLLVRYFLRSPYFTAIWRARGRGGRFDGGNGEMGMPFIEK